MQLKLDQLITIAWDQDSGGHVSIVSALNVWPNGAVSVFLKERNYFQSIMGDSPLGAALNPSVNPNISNVMTCQVNTLPEIKDHIHPGSHSWNKKFSLFWKRSAFPGEDCGDSGSELGGPGCHHHILPRSAHGEKLGRKKSYCITICWYLHMYSPSQSRPF